MVNVVAVVNVINVVVSMIDVMVSMIDVVNMIEMNANITTGNDRGRGGDLARRRGRQLGSGRRGQRSPRLLVVRSTWVSKI